MFVDQTAIVVTKTLNNFVLTEIAFNILLVRLLSKLKFATFTNIYHFQFMK